MTNVREFQLLFRGREDALGTGEGPVERRPVTTEDYAAHLRGEGKGIGIFPMLDDHHVWFAAIDLDEPDFELALTMQKLLPGQSWIERSRSGNAHVWVFFSAPAPAWAVRAVLRGATEAVGRQDVEIFPKQDGLRKGGVGNFINLPYHGEERPILSAPTEGTPYHRDVFLGKARGALQDPEDWVRRARTIGGKPPEERTATSEWGTSPLLHMCAEKIIAERETNPLRPGHRHQVLFHLAVQCLNYRDATEQEARDWVDLVNEAAVEPLSNIEVDRLFDNARDGQFTFTGCDDPVMQPYVHPDCKIAKGEAGR